MVAEFDASGLPAEDFCARRRVKPGTLRWWRWRLGETRAERAVELVPVEVAPVRAVRTAGELQVVIGDVALHIRIGDDVTYIGALIAEIRTTC